MNEVLTRRFSSSLRQPALMGKMRGGVAWASGLIDATTGCPKRAHRPDSGRCGRRIAFRLMPREPPWTQADVPVVGPLRFQEVWDPRRCEFASFCRAPGGSHSCSTCATSHTALRSRSTRRRSKAQRRSVLDSIPGLDLARQPHCSAFWLVKGSGRLPSNRLLRSRRTTRATIRDRPVTSSREDTPCTLTRFPCRCRRACRCCPGSRTRQGGDDRPATLRVHRHQCDLIGNAPRCRSRPVTRLRHEHPMP